MPSVDVDRTVAALREPGWHTHVAASDYSRDGDVYGEDAPTLH
jgi:hypothetical protein